MDKTTKTGIMIKIENLTGNKTALCICVELMYTRYYTRDKL